MQPIYLINLPNHKEKLLKFKKQNSFLLNHVYVFEAYNGQSLSRRQLILNKYITERNNYDPRSLGIMMSHVELWKIAAKSKHGIIIAEDDVIIHSDFIEQSKQIIKNYPTYDLIAWSYNLDWPIQMNVAKGLPTVLTSYKIKVGDPQFNPDGQIGFYGDKINQKEYFNSIIHPKLTKVLMFTGLSFYSISPKGAKYLLNQLPIDNENLYFISYERFYFNQSGIDMSLAKFYPNMEAYICSPFLAFSPNEKQWLKD